MAYVSKSFVRLPSMTVARILNPKAANDKAETNCHIQATNALSRHCNKAEANRNARIAQISTTSSG